MILVVRERAADPPSDGSIIAVMYNSGSASTSRLGG